MVKIVKTVKIVQMVKIFSTVNLSNEITKNLWSTGCPVCAKLNKGNKIIIMNMFNIINMTHTLYDHQGVHCLHGQPGQNSQNDQQDQHFQSFTLLSPVLQFMRRCRHEQVTNVHSARLVFKSSVSGFAA